LELKSLIDIKMRVLKHVLLYVYIFLNSSMSETPDEEVDFGSFDI